MSSVFCCNFDVESDVETFYSQGLEGERGVGIHSVGRALNFVFLSLVNINIKIQNTPKAEIFLVGPQ